MDKIIQTIFISIVIIYILDCLVKYFRDTYTTKKTKDVVGFHIKKYQSMMDQMRDNQLNETPENIPPTTSTKLSEQELLYMNEELESLLLTELGPASP